MSAEEKTAWLAVGLFAVGVVAFLVLIPFGGVEPALAGFSVVGFSGLGPLLFRKKRDSKEVAEDERDKKIIREATLGAAHSCWCVAVMACMIPWGIHMFHDDMTISIHALPRVVFCGLFTFILVRSVTILVLYRRGKPNGED